MSIRPVELMWSRAEKTRKNGTLDFDELLYVGEAIFKTYVVAMVAAVDDDPERQRYTLAYKVVRGNSLGDWDNVLAELSTGTAAQHLRPTAIDAHQELTGPHRAGSWMHSAVTHMHSCVKTFVLNAEPLPSKFDGRK